MINKLSLVLFFVLHCALASSADTETLYPVKDQIQALLFYKASYEPLFGKPQWSNVQEFYQAAQTLKEPKRVLMMEFIKKLEAQIPEPLLLPLAYWRFVVPNIENQKTALRVLGHTRLNLLKDFIDHPLQGSSSEKAEARRLLEELSENTWTESHQVFLQTSVKVQALASPLVQATSTQQFVNMFSRTPLFSKNLWMQIPQLPPFSLSWHRFIPGNRVEVISENIRSMDRIQWVNDHAIFAGGTLDFNLPYMKMPEAQDSGNPVWRDPIFAKIREMIDGATDSIFIDIFLFGGTMGGTLAKHLIDQGLQKRQKNPLFQILILHDYATNYNMKEEMMPVFNYMRNRIQTEPAVANLLVMLQANIQRHPPGVPFGITQLIPKTPESFKNFEQKNTYYESKIDHSKVIVVDANTDHPKAYFGSKNWSDHSGAYYFDDAIYVEGPAAALVQAAYYDDVDAALTTDPIEQAWFYYKEQGFDNRHYLKQKKEILSWLKISRENYPFIGDQIVRIVEANVDGKIKDFRNILIDMIQKAQNHIYMEQLFIYDPYIIDALLKKKVLQPNLDVRILADHNGNFNMNGLPNTIFMKELLDQGIQIKARKTIGVEAQFKDGTKKTYHQENHRKITSVDGTVLLGGSSNINYDTLQGSFREFGAQIFDTNEIAQFEREFLIAWEDSRQTEDLKGEEINLQLGKTSLGLELSGILNHFMGVLVRSKDALEKR